MFLYFQGCFALNTEFAWISPTDWKYVEVAWDIGVGKFISGNIGIAFWKYRLGIADSNMFFGETLGCHTSKKFMKVLLLYHRTRRKVILVRIGWNISRNMDIMKKWVVDFCKVNISIY